MAWSSDTRTDAARFADEMKVTPRLTMNLGLRYQLHQPWRENHGRMSVFDIGSGSIVVTFSKHPVVSSLIGLGLDLILPRSVGQLKGRPQAADAPHVDELAFSGPLASAAFSIPVIGASVNR